MSFGAVNQRRTEAQGFEFKAKVKFKVLNKKTEEPQLNVLHATLNVSWWWKLLHLLDRFYNFWIKKNLLFSLSVMEGIKNFHVRRKKSKKNHESVELKSNLKFCSEFKVFKFEFTCLVTWVHISAFNTTKLHILKPQQIKQKPSAWPNIAANNKKKRHNEPSDIMSVVVVEPFNSKQNELLINLIISCNNE